MIHLKQADIFVNFHIAETVLKNAHSTFEHTHDFYELFFITDGMLKHHINGKALLLATNTLSIIFPSDQHCFQKQGVKDTHFINLAFPANLFDQVLALYQSFYENPLSSFQGKFVELPPGLSQSLLSKITHLYRDLSPMNERAKKDLLISLLLDVLIVLNNINSSELAPPDWLLKAFEQMRSRENYLLGLPRFIELSGKSQEHLTRMMKKYYQMSPTAYLNSIKLAYATYLLSTTTLSILDILYASGYENVSYFNHLFKQEYNMTPRQFRYLNSRIINPKSIS